LTDIPEGTIVRVITRLDETCREVRDAARVIGDADLFTKMEEAQALIKRDSESVCSMIRWSTDRCSCVCCQFVSIIIWLKRFSWHSREVGSCY
jgi:hypothetical protein